MQDVTMLENLMALKQLLNAVQGQLTESQAIGIIMSNRLVARDGELAAAQAQVEKLTAELAIATAGHNGAAELEPTPIRG